MDPKDIGEALQNLDRRIDRVEQFLPTLATKDALRQAIAPLATREELRQAIAPLATRDEVREGLREEGARSRRHMDVLVEKLTEKIDLFAEAHVALEQRDASQHAETQQAMSALDTRVMKVEATRQPGRRLRR